MPLLVMAWQSGFVALELMCPRAMRFVCGPETAVPDRKQA